MDVVSTAQCLVAIDSVTAASNSVASARYAELLRELHFELEELRYTDSHGTAKICLAARRGPRNTNHGGIGFFCHNDVVSVDGWSCPHGGPFDAAIAEGRMWGRGACDMKGPTAAALAAISRIDLSQQHAPLYFFVTGDEECGMAGARLLAESSAYFAELVSQQGVGIIGEPTSLQVVNTHKGGCHLDVISTGLAAHSSTAEGRNANWQMIPFLAYLEKLHRRCETESQYLNLAFSPPTMSINVVIENRPASANITVGQAVCRIFFRPMPETQWKNVLDDIVGQARTLGLDVAALQPLPPLCTPDDSPFVQTALDLLQQDHPRAVSYATDGCCFDQLTELIVIGPGNIEQAHRPDEWIEIDQLSRGVEVYHRLFQHYAAAQPL